ncbi:protein translocase subunit [Tilletia horrida]|nr:protein translocase subunit [Tilletia horrida]
MASRSVAAAAGRRLVVGRQSPVVAAAGVSRSSSSSASTSSAGPLAARTYSSSPRTPRLHSAAALRASQLHLNTRHFASSSTSQQQSSQQQQQNSQDQSQSDSKDDKGNADDKGKQKKSGGGGGGGDGIIRSPFQAFVDTLRTELQKSREMQEGMTALQGEVGKAQDSETMRKARDTYERMMLRVSLQENPRLRAAAERLRKDGGKVSEAVAATLKQMEESELIKGLSNTSVWLARQLADSTAPIRQTEAYRTLSETILEALDDGGSSIRIYATKDEDVKALRARKRNLRLAKIGRSPPAVEDVEDEKYWAERDRIKAIRKAEEEAAEIRAAAEAAAAAEAEEAGEQPTESQTPSDASSSSEPIPSASSSPSAKESEPHEPLQKAPPPPPPSGFALQDPLVARVNPQAGTGLVAVAGSASDDTPSVWSRFKSVLPFNIDAAKERYEESENPVVERIRWMGDGIKSFLFDENETAAAIRLLRRIEPSFTMDKFQRQLREYIAPEIVDAMHSANRTLLKQWCTERTYSVVFSQIEPILKEPGAAMHGNLLDIRSVDVVQGKLLDSPEAIETNGQVPVIVVRWETTELLYFTSSNPKRIAEHEAAEQAKLKARKARASAAKDGAKDEAPASSSESTASKSASASSSAKTVASSEAAAGKNAETAEGTASTPKSVVIAGSKDRAESCVYVAVLGRNDKDTDNVITGGWKLMELIRRGEAAYL